MDTIGILISTTIDSDSIVGRPGLQLQTIYTDAHALSILNNIVPTSGLVFSSLDLIEEIENSSKLKYLARSYLEKATNFHGLFCSFEKHHGHIDDIYEKLAAGIEELLVVMAELGKEESALDGRLKSIKEWRRRWISAYTAVIIAPLIVSPVLACMEMPYKVIFSTVAVPGILKGLQYWLDSLWGEWEKELERTRDVAKTMRRFAFREKDELENIQTLARKLYEDLGTVRVQMDDDGLGMVKEKMAEEVEKDMRGTVKACAAGVEKSAVEFLKYIAKA